MHAHLHTEAGQIAHYAAIKRRLFGPNTDNRPKPVLVLVEPENIKAPVGPLWKRTETHFDAHVMNWNWYRASVLGKPTKRYLVELAGKLFLPYRDIVGPSRRHPLVDHRMIAMYVLRYDFNCSYPEIGRLLGGRDHSTCVSGVKKVERLMSQGLDISQYRRAAE